MLELVFDESLGEGLSMAKGRRGGRRLAADRGVAYGEVKEEGRLHKNRAESHGAETVWSGEPLEGPAAGVLQLILDLDMGALADLDTPGMDGRYALIKALGGQGSQCWGPPQDQLLQTQEGNAYALQRLFQAKETGEPVRIWVTPWYPREVCGLYHACHLLRDSGCPVDVVWAPWEQVRVRDDGSGTFIRSLGQYFPKELSALALRAEPLEKLRLQNFAARWEQLAAENAPLRALVNGRIISVPEDFYDFVLREHLAAEPVTVASVLLKTRTALSGVGIGWLYLRLRAMLEAGELSLAEAEDPERPYSAKIRRIG